jgi:hypothetical protein
MRRLGWLLLVVVRGVVPWMMIVDGEEGEEVGRGRSGMRKWR